MMKYLGLLILGILSCVQGQTPPNIFIFMADDLGRFDVSFNSNNDYIVTPNIDALGYYGIFLKQFYVHAMCTPSRSALMTGKYCIHTGMQHGVINNDEPYGMDPDTKILPQFLKDVGYKTHLVGKWHLGMARRRFNPIQRGFDSFYGYLGGYITYYTQDLWLGTKPWWPVGHDFRKNETINNDLQGMHATEIFTLKAIDAINEHDTTEPLFLMVNHLAPHSENPIIAFPDTKSKYLNDYAYIINPMQKRLAVEMSILDDSIGRVVAAIKAKGMMDNSIIIFMSDNGAPSLGLLQNFGNNYPLRGQKDGPFEGATRVPAVIWSPLLKKKEYVSNHLMHVTDLTVTLATAAGCDLTNHTFDGMDMWPTLSNQVGSSPRTSIVHNIDDYTSYMKKGWKYVSGSTNLGLFDGHVGDTFQRDAIVNPHKGNYYSYITKSTVSNILRAYRPNKKDMNEVTVNKLRAANQIWCTKPKTPCFPIFGQKCLFYVYDDPCENQNLFDSRPDIVADLEADIWKLRKTMVPPRNIGSDPNSNPANNEYRWTWWLGD